MATRHRNKHIGSSLEDWLEEESAKDPSFAAGLDEGLSQKQLAERVKTKQPSIARLEGARAWPRLDLLQRVARALGAEMIVSFRRPQAARRSRERRAG